MVLEIPHKQCFLKEHFYVGVVQVHAKSPDAFIIRHTAAFLDRVRTGEIEVRQRTSIGDAGREGG